MMLKEIYTEEIDSISYVSSGEVAVGNSNEILMTSPLGSCVAVIAYAPFSRTGGIAHVMLPGHYSGKQKENNQFKYARDAISYLVYKLQKIGAEHNDLQFSLVGGANVLRKKGCNIGNEIIKSVNHILSENKALIKASSLGGFQRRTAKLDIKSGIVFYTLGNSREMMLCNFNE